MKLSFWVSVLERSSFYDIFGMILAKPLSRSSGLILLVG